MVGIPLFFPIVDQHGPLHEVDEGRHCPQGRRIIDHPVRPDHVMFFQKVRLDIVFRVDPFLPVQASQVVSQILLPQQRCPQIWVDVIIIGHVKSLVELRI